MNQGWLKLHRQLFDKPIWLNSTPQQKTILIAILGMANHEVSQWEWGGEPYLCGPGQFITSLEGIQAHCGKGVSIRNIRTALRRFQTCGFLTNKSTKHNRLITICNWAAYQKCDDKSDNRLTNDRQTPDNQLTTNKNDKNEKNEKNNRRSFLNFQNNYVKGRIYRTDTEYKAPSATTDECIEL